MKELFLEYFRCPSSLIDFRLTSPLSDRKGFFRFGPDLTCFGVLSAGQVCPDPRSSLPDVSIYAGVESNTCLFPFDPDEVVQNLRYERYRSTLVPNGWKRNSALRSAYYAVRPALPIAVRKHFQRFALRSWQQTPFPHWPVDQTVDRLFERLMAASVGASHLKRIPFIWFWPDAAPAAAIMTHDVETRAGLDFCPHLMDIDDSFGIKSSFQIVPEERYAIPPDLLLLLRKRGFEINVHDINHDGNLFRDRQEFLRRAARINLYARKFDASGYRSGVLYRNLDWYDAFEFSYDMSVPNAGHLEPQPGGCCTTKPFFVGKILELPVMGIQDYSLHHILRTYSLDLWDRQIEIVLSRNGLLSFIVHPDYLLDSRSQQMYSGLLERLARLRRESRLWFALPGEVNQWWRDRANMQLVQREGRWLIEGQGSHRARIAFATVEGDRLIYSLVGQEPSAPPLPAVKLAPAFQTGNSLIQ